MKCWFVEVFDEERCEWPRYTFRIFEEAKPMIDFYDSFGFHVIVWEGVLKC